MRPHPSSPLGELAGHRSDHTETVESTPEATDQQTEPRAGTALGRAVGRIPLGVRAKLSIASLGTVVLLIVVGVLGLRVLGQSNARVEALEALQLRASAYGELRSDAAQVRQLLALRAGNSSADRYSGGGSSTAQSPGSLTVLDQTIASRLGQLGQAADGSQLGFVPPPDDEASLDGIRSDTARLTELMTRIEASDAAGDAGSGRQLQPKAENAANDLQVLAVGLVSSARSQTQLLAAQNRSAFTDSQRLSIAVAAGSVGLALVLGLFVSASLIGPIRHVDTRVAAIAGGDFSGHVDVPNRDELGTLGANVNRMNDELGRLYGELATASRHKSEFLANMSHELRTPMNAIIGFSEVLQQQMFGPLNEQQLGYVEDVLDAARHLLSLINDILDLAKVEAGRMELELGDVSIPLILQSGLTMHAERALRGGVTLAMDVDPDDIVVRADERKVRQVVFNLLSNAVKFTPPSGHVDVSARRVDGVAEIAVHDTGPGIAPEDQELIFEEFGQTRGGAEAQEGTGLGLPLSRRFVELHGGRLWVESSIGEGSTFRFTLPVERTVRNDV